MPIEEVLQCIVDVKAARIRLSQIDRTIIAPGDLEQLACTTAFAHLGMNAMSLLPRTTDPMPAKIKAKCSCATVQMDIPEDTAIPMVVDIYDSPPFKSPKRALGRY